MPTLINRFGGFWISGGGLQDSWFSRQFFSQPEAIARDALDLGSFSMIFRTGGELSSFILQDRRSSSAEDWRYSCETRNLPKVLLTVGSSHRHVEAAELNPLFLSFVTDVNLVA